VLPVVTRQFVSLCRYNLQRPGEMNRNYTVHSRSAVSPSSLSTWLTMNAVLPFAEPHGERSAPINWVRFSIQPHSWRKPSLNRVSSGVLPPAKRLVSGSFLSHVNNTASSSHYCSVTIYSAFTL